MKNTAVTSLYDSVSVLECQRSLWQSLYVNLQYGAERPFLIFWYMVASMQHDSHHMH